MNNYYVYGLIDPRTNSIFYIGKGKNKRIYQHLKEKPDLFSNIEKLNKINEIQESGFDVDFIYITTDLSEEIAFFIEKTIIYRLGRKIFGEGELTNIVPGGVWRKGDSYFLRPSQIPTNKLINDFLPQFIEVLNKYPKISKQFTGLQCPSNPLDNKLHVYDDSGIQINSWNIDEFIDIFGLHSSMEIINAINRRGTPIYAWNRLWSICNYDKLVNVKTVPFSDFDFINIEFVEKIKEIQDLKQELEFECETPNSKIHAEIKQTEKGGLIKLTGYYSNGVKKYESSQINGVNNDTWFEWYENGITKTEKKYLKSSLVYEKSFHKNGKNQKLIKYDSSGNWTTMTEWYDNGQVMFENNKRGEYFRFSDDGVLLDSYEKTAVNKR